MLRQALILHRQGRLSEAAALYRRIVAQNPKAADALHLLGVIELQRRNFAGAVELIDRAIALDSGNAAYFSNRGVALQDLKRFDDAIASYDRALALRSDLPEVLNNRGTVLRELKRFDEALASYDEALELRGDYAEAHNNRGNALKELQRFDEALMSYDRALAIAPRYAEAHRNRASVLHILQRHGDAMASYERAIVLKSDDAQAYNALANILAEQGRLDEAIARYRSALAVKPAYAEAHLNLGKVLKHQGALDDAIAHYRQASAIVPRYAAAHLELSDALVEAGRIAEALSAAEAAALLADGPDFPHFPLGVLFARCDRLEEARRHLLKSLELDESDPQGARLILAGIGAGPLPERASETHLRRLYTARAGRWSRADATAYRGHEWVAEKVRTLCPGRAALDILDAGCGTGLAGAKLRDIARRLDGVDVNPAMLAKAKDAGAYDRLHEGDLVAFLNAHPARYDVIVSAATLIHFGDLTPVFAAAAHALRTNGLFVFTVFPNDREADTGGVAVAPLGGLGEGGCFVHGREYLSRAAAAAGFSVVLMEAGRHECDNNGAPVTGLIVALRRGESGAAN